NSTGLSRRSYPTFKRRGGSLRCVEEPEFFKRLIGPDCGGRGARTPGRATTGAGALARHGQGKPQSARRLQRRRLRTADRSPRAPPPADRPALTYARPADRPALTNARPAVGEAGHHTDFRLMPAPMRRPYDGRPRWGRGGGYRHDGPYGR